MKGKQRMRTMMLFLLIAASLPSAVRAQNATPPPAGGTQNTQPPPATQPGKLEDDPAFKQLSPEQRVFVKKTMDKVEDAIQRKDVDALEDVELALIREQLVGLTLCGHVIDEGTYLDAAPHTTSQHYAFAVRWLDSRSSAVHTAIFSNGKRCVVTDGETVDGKVVARALPNSLAVSNRHALVAWEAEYFNSAAEQAKGGTPHRGVFIENRFLTELDPHKASVAGSRDVTDETRDFRWNEAQETLPMKPGVVLTEATPTCAAAAPKKPSFLDKLKQHAEHTVENQARRADTTISKGSGGNVDSGVGDATTTAVNESNQPKPCTPASGKATK
jgi:hypothetical protein